MENNFTKKEMATVSLMFAISRDFIEEVGLKEPFLFFFVQELRRVAKTNREMDKLTTETEVVTEKILELFKQTGGEIDISKFAEVILET